MSSPTTSSLTSAITAPFKDLLLARRASLQSQLATLRGGPVGRVEASAEHFAAVQDSPSQTSTERELELALDDRESAELNQVEEALQRIEAGTYGLCADCQVPIAPARLQAAPEALRCVHCQEKLEHKA